MAHSLSIYNRNMARERKIGLKCPTCKQPVGRTAEEFPFCSERCRLIDLGKWASGQYVVSSPMQDTDDAEIQNLRDTTDEE